MVAFPNLWLGCAAKEKWTAEAQDDVFGFEGLVQMGNGLLFEVCFPFSLLWLHDALRMVHLLWWWGLTIGCAVSPPFMWPVKTFRYI